MKYRIKPLDEDFFNPFDKPDDAPKKPVKISDTGGIVKPRKEIFNINRVVYSKRPNGEFTVLSKTQFAQNEIIEICPIIFVGVEAKAINRLKDFVFEIEKEKDGKPGMYGLVLGYGSLYKHSDTPNCSYAYNRANRQMYFMASRPIQAQEELTIDYGKDYWNERATFSTLAPKNETPPSTEVAEGLEGGIGDNTPAGSANANMRASANPKNSANPGRSGIPPMTQGM
jgi:hypothetical protein